MKYEYYHNVCHLRFCKHNYLSIYRPICEIVYGGHCVNIRPAEKHGICHGDIMTTFGLRWYAFTHSRKPWTIEVSKSGKISNHKIPFYISIINSLFNHLTSNTNSFPTTRVLSPQQARYETSFANVVYATAVRNTICIHNKTYSPIIIVTSLVFSATVKYMAEHSSANADGFSTHSRLAFVHTRLQYQYHAYKNMRRDRHIMYNIYTVI